MTATTPNPLTAGRLPRWATGAGLAAGFGAAAAVWAVATGGVDPAPVALVGFGLFLGGMHVASLVVEGPRRATDRLARHIVATSFVLALLPLVSVLWTTLARGLQRLDLTFLTHSMRNVIGDGGGAAHALTGTLIVTGLATLISVPVGLLTAVYLSEYGRGGGLARAITFFVDVMTGIPSIVAGLFAYALMALLFGPGTINGFSGSIALSVLMIPVVVRSTEELLRIVPNDLREASYALGVPKWRTILRIVIPTAISGLVSGVILAIARVIGETAPLMVAAGFTDSLNRNPFDGPMMTMPVFVFDAYAYPGIQREFDSDRGWAGALTLIIVVMLLNLLGRAVARRFAPRTGR